MLMFKRIALVYETIDQCREEANSIQELLTANGGSPELRERADRLKAKSIRLAVEVQRIADELGVDISQVGEYDPTS